MRRKPLQVLGVSVGAMLLVTVGARAHTTAEVSCTCPIDGTQFTAIVDASGTSFGQRLDRKPFGPTPAPWRLKVCPSCHMVVYDEKLPAETVAKLRPFITSAEYQALAAADHSSYYLFAAIKRFLGASELDLGLCYLQASWQVEDEVGRWRDYLGEAASHLARSTEDAKRHDEDWFSTRLLVGELLRLRGELVAARVLLESFLADETGLPDVVGWLTRYELELIADGDTAPHKTPRPVNKDWVAPRRLARSLQGFDIVDGLLELDGSEYERSAREVALVSRLRGRDDGMPLDRAIWVTPLADTDACADWQDFLPKYLAAETQVMRSPWLQDWHRQGADRHIQVVILSGLGSPFEGWEEPQAAWKIGGLKGAPALAISLQRGDEQAAIVILSESGEDAVILGAYSGAGGHWLDSLDFHFSTYFTSELVVVGSDGTWRKVSHEVAPPEENEADESSGDEPEPGEPS